MPLSMITKPAFPNVPDVSGVPVIKRSNRTSPVVRVVLGRIQSEIWRALNTQHQWGIFDQNGKALVTADTVLEVSYKDSARISQYPIAEGSFANYNKVSNPKEITIRLCKGGGLSTAGELVNIFKNGLGNVGKAALNARSHFLDKIEQLKQSFELINIVTPEKTYISYSVSDYSFRREKSNGAYMIFVDLNLIEVRNVKAQYSKTEQVSTQHAQSPDATPIQNNGKVQTDTVTDPQPVRSAVQSFIGA